MDWWREEWVGRSHISSETGRIGGTESIDRHTLSLSHAHATQHYLINHAANRCPEWAMDEVIAMIAADFRIASLAALLAILYEFGGVTTSYLVYAHLKRYQCEYI